MNTKTIAQFETLNTEMLASVEGGVDCFDGIVGIGSLGSVAGPWGAVGGVLIGMASFCM